MQITKPPQKILFILEKSVVLQRDSWLQIKKKKSAKKFLISEKALKHSLFYLKHSATTLEKKKQG